ncbi:type IV secretory system conjugative DNA transfer family protein [Gordonia humi]|uniref:Type IV secretory pathway TraG/TraD family ATPase VirD4 n=1 Tax=Gordonia humi TaxID=686429 RepID=A0A840F863_9ACTN|nr:TraM recognition domain-containing protein [Gordonia humi]MBB4138076.1 type IV secretory pathway TraG/TraD family ATPase VirD4 [Gordonia humi]
MSYHDYPPHRGTDPATTLILTLMGAVLGVLLIGGGGLAVAGAISGLLSGHGWAWPSGGDDPAPFAAVKAAWTSPGTPANGWPATAPAPGPGWLFWLVFIALLTAIGVCAWKIWAFVDERKARREIAERGLASAQDLHHANLTEHAAVERARTSQMAGSDVVDPTLAAIYVGVHRDSKQSVFVQHRDCTLIEGPTGSGKTWRSAVQRCWDAPGFLMVTTTKADLIAATLAERQTYGEIAVFDPERLTGWPHPLRWSVLAGCQDPTIAIRRAEAMVKAAPMDNVKDSSFWQTRGSVVLRCCLMAAALADLRLRDIREWVGSMDVSQPYQILSKLYPEWAGDMQQLMTSESSSVGDVFATAATMLEPLADPAIREMVDVPATESIDLAAFVLHGANTLYISCEADQPKVAPIVAAMAAEVYQILNRQSQLEPSGRLTVPARLVLDEVNNIAPIPGLPNKMTDSGGRGICIWAYAHNRLQSIKRWGRDAGQEFTINAPNRIILPGLGDIDELESISRLFGTRLEQRSERPGDVREVPVLSAQEIRELPEGQALMIYRNARPIIVELPTVWERPDLDAAVTDSTALFNHIRQTGNVHARIEDLGKVG